MDSDFVTSLLATWHSLIDVHVPELPCPAGAGQSPDSFFTTYWDKSSETSGGLVFDSTLCSLASSPFSLPNASNDGSLIRELIGKMGGSGELSPQNYNPGLFHSEDSPKWGHYSPPVNPGFTDLSPAAKFPSLGARSLRGCVGQFTELAEMGKMMSRVSSSPALRPLGSPVGAPQGSKNQNPASQDRAELSNSREESSVSNPDKNPGLEAGAKPPGETNWRKRKAAPGGKEADAEDGSGMKRVKQSDGDNGNEDGSAKTEEEAGGGSDENAGGQDEKLKVKTEAKPPEPPKDYIHVRARRGQATDSHSLAERVRREKISERMKILQDLVPGCSKVTGKALMLDEIINYVQSLQRQVEFLSMKLASVNSSMDTNTNTTTVVKDKNPAANVSSGAMPQYSVGPLINSQFLTVNQYQSFHGDDLQKIVQMGYGQN